MKLKSFILIGVLAVFLGYGLIVSLPSNSAKAADDVDQFCENAEITAAADFILFTGHTLSQSFTPATNTLTLAGLTLAAGADGIASFNLELRRVSDNALIATSNATTNSPLVAWVMFPFDNVALTIGAQYSLHPTTTSGTATWIYSPVPCYSGGQMTIDSAAQSNQDFGFSTQGHGVNPPASAPTSETTTIEAPSNLVGAYDIKAKNVKLVWKKSAAASLTGYKVYRSGNKDRDYKLLASVEGDVLTYIDAKDLSDGTYYYHVKAYKDDNESAMSNIATVTVGTMSATAKTTTANAAASLSFWGKLFGPWVWYTVAVLGVVVVVLGVLLYFLIRKRKLKSRIFH